VRAIEIYEQTGIPKSTLVQEHPVDHPLLMISMIRGVDTANKLIHQRVEEMIERGLVEEVKLLLKKGYTPDLQSMNGIGYRQTIQWLEEKNGNMANLIDSISLASIQYAKRQRTRFRRYKKDSTDNPKRDVIYKEINMDI
jgi:tRNA dimethylallyltransferase